MRFNRACHIASFCLSSFLHLIAPQHFSHNSLFTSKIASFAALRKLHESQEGSLGGGVGTVHAGGAGAQPFRLGSGSVDNSGSRLPLLSILEHKEGLRPPSIEPRLSGGLLRHFAPDRRGSFLSGTPSPRERARSSGIINVDEQSHHQLQHQSASPSPLALAGVLVAESSVESNEHLAFDSSRGGSVSGRQRSQQMHIELPLRLGSHSNTSGTVERLNSGLARSTPPGAQTPVSLAGSNRSGAVASYLGETLVAVYASAVLHPCIMSGSMVGQSGLGRLVFVRERKGSPTTTSRILLTHTRPSLSTHTRPSKQEAALLSSIYFQNCQDELDKRGGPRRR